MKNAVVVFFLRKDGQEILLARKHQGSEVAKLKLNGYGGKIEKGETPIIASIRETVEETDGFINLKETDLQYGGVVVFKSPDKKVSDFRVHVFYCPDVFTDLPPSTEVMIDPAWYDLNKLNELSMMPADKLFLPLILKDRKVISGEVIFEEGFKGVKDFSFKELSSEEIKKLLAEVER